MSTDFPYLDELDQHITELSRADQPAEVFRLLLEGARLAAPRAAVYLVRQGQIKGWGSVGYDRETAQGHRAYSSAADSGWLGEVAAQPGTDLRRRESTGADPDFGQSASDEAVAVQIRVKQRPIALLVAERTGDETPWFPQCLGMMVRVAQLRLDFDLALRKLKASSPAVERPAVAEPATPVGAGIETAQPTEAGTANAAAAPPEPAQAAPASATEVLPVPETEEPSGDAQVLDAAKRYARLVATDIRLYNEEAVLLGRRHGDLIERLSEHLTRGRETFLRRHGDLGPTGLHILRDAYVQVLAGGNDELVPGSVVKG